MNLDEFESLKTTDGKNIDRMFKDWTPRVPSEYEEVEYITGVTPGTNEVPVLRVSDKVIGIYNTSTSTFTAASDQTKTYGPIISNQKEIFFSGKAIEEPFTERLTASGMLIKKKAEAKCVKVLGNTVVWNQQVKNGNFVSGTSDWYAEIGVQLSVTSKNTITVTNNNYTTMGLFQNFNSIVNHIYLIQALVYSEHLLQIKFKNCPDNTIICNTPGIMSLISTICIDSSSVAPKAFYMRAKEAVPYTFTLKYYTCFDLTQMFGSDANICKALHVPNLTTTENKALAIENFKALFPLEYYDYNPGKLLDTKLIGKWSGWNQLVNTNTTLVTVPNGHVYVFSDNGIKNRYISTGTSFSVVASEDNVFDLTQLFGAGNEPTTVAQFETWMKEHGMNPDEYQPYTASSSLLPSRIACTMPQQGQVACVDDSNPTNIKRYLKWPSEMTATDKSNAVGVVFAVDDEKGYIVGNGNNTTKQWSCVADYEITSIPNQSGSYSVKLNNVVQGNMTYVKGDGSIREFTEQLETFLRGCDASSKAAKWEAYTNPDTGKSYLQMFNYNEYESTVTVQGCTLSKLIGSELAPYTNSTIHNQIGQSMNYCCGMCRQRIEEYCTNSGSNPSTAMDGVTQLYPANSAPCSKAYYDGALGVNLRAHYPTYGEYMDACMVKLDKNGNDIMKWWDGKYYTSLLAAKTVLKQGVETPAYAAADYCIKYDGGQPGFRAGDWFLPSFYQEGLLMKDIRGDKQDPVNKALTFLGWQTISTTSHRWSSSRYGANHAWHYNSYGQCAYGFNFSLTVSVVSAFNISDFVYDAPANSSTSSTLFLPQANTDIILRSAGSVRDEIVGNKIIRRVGTVDMGTLTWGKMEIDETNYRFVTTTLKDDIKYATASNVMANILCQKFETSTHSNVTGAGLNNGISVSISGSINCFGSSYNSMTNIQFKTAMSGVYLNYELATPTTETLPEDWEKHFTVYNQGTETLLPKNLSTPYTSPLLPSIRYKNVIPQAIFTDNSTEQNIFTDIEGSILCEPE